MFDKIKTLKKSKKMDEMSVQMNTFYFNVVESDALDALRYNNIGIQMQLVLYIQYIIQSHY